MNDAPRCANGLLVGVDFRVPKLGIGFEDLAYARQLQGILKPID
jgi:hypothetical protein